jgi:type IV pilus assembly protein PilZ
MPAEEKREEGRAPITLRVDYRRLNTFFADYTKNISKGGTFIKTTKPLDVGTEFVFVLALPDADGGEAQKLELTGEVRWIVSEPEASDEKPAGMGIQFVFQDEGQRRKVEDFVADLMSRALGPQLASRLLAR